MKINSKYCDYFIESNTFKYIRPNCKREIYYELNNNNNHNNNGKCGSRFCSSGQSNDRSSCRRCGSEMGGRRRGSDGSIQHHESEWGNYQSKLLSYLYQKLPTCVHYWDVLNRISYYRPNETSAFIDISSNDVISIPSQDGAQLNATYSCQSEKIDSFIDTVIWGIINP
ncbi:hypothetical protein Glove_97g31 [Diversispora epigaea]|uniref:Uncharacterized protein n=1 Tax=Diversispora epigaea TaxID=1348612 RepID=A0A397JE86_9GLOM|nr:hypothetical protein Glove_97g31 [Diversispora epigaea]